MSLPPSVKKTIEYYKGWNETYILIMKYKKSFFYVLSKEKTLKNKDKLTNIIKKMKKSKTHGKYYPLCNKRGFKVFDAIQKISDLYFTSNDMFEFSLLTKDHFKTHITNLVNSDRRLEYNRLPYLEKEINESHNEVEYHACIINYNFFDLILTHEIMISSYEDDLIFILDGYSNDMFLKDAYILYSIFQNLNNHQICLSLNMMWLYNNYGFPEKLDT